MTVTKKAFKWPTEKMELALRKKTQDWYGVALTHMQVSAVLTLDPQLGIVLAERTRKHGVDRTSVEWFMTGLSLAFGCGPWPHAKTLKHVAMAHAAMFAQACQRRGIPYTAVTL